MRKAPCSIRKPLCSSGKPLIRVRQPDECRGEAFCSIGASTNCPGKARSFAGKALRFAGEALRFVGKALSFTASLFARRAKQRGAHRKASILAPEVQSLARKAFCFAANALLLAQ
jgi:hypothetical protein